MPVEYLFADSGPDHYYAFMDYVEEVEGYTDQAKMDFLNRRLKEFHGKMIEVTAYRDSIGVLGIEFETTQDLLFFKLRFN